MGKLTFDTYVPDAGPHTLAVEYTDIGFEAVPRLDVNGHAVIGSVAEAKLTAGKNRIEIKGGEYALDVDYLEVLPGGR